MIPKHNVQEFTDTDGKITLLIPKFKKEWMRKYLIPKRKSPHFRIHLDELGSKVWRIINGYLTVEDICLKIKDITQGEGKPLELIEERVTIFLSDLYHRKYIVFENLSQ
jgi:hypothetical protein